MPDENDLLDEFMEHRDPDNPNPFKKYTDGVTLNTEQAIAVSEAMFLIEETPPRTDEHFLVSGLAGTGKTVTLIELVRALLEAGYKPAVCAPTGKAAHVITGKAKGLFHARTLHSVLTENPLDHIKEINAQITELRKAIHRGQMPKDEAERRIEELEVLSSKFERKNSMSFSPIDPEDFHTMFDCIVCDEASMVGKSTMMRPFMDPIKCVKFFFGDYGQLPPVQDEPAVDLSDPDVLLTEIHRQAADSGIIKVAHHIRNRNEVGKEFFETHDDLTSGTETDMNEVLKYAEDHQILVWKNATRHSLNLPIRKARGFDFMSLPPKDQMRPMVGEELMFDQNIKDRGIFKGMPFTVVAVEETEDYEKRENRYLTKITLMLDNDIELEGVINFSDLVPPNIRFHGSEKEDKFERIAASRMGINVMYPYALTVHKAQGSEWEKVCVIGEYPASMNEFKEWMYTAATRAAKELVVLSKMYFKKPHKGRTIAERRAARAALKG